MTPIRGYVHNLRLHVFRGNLAVSVDDVSDGGSRDPVETETLYLSPGMVRQLQEELARFTLSHFLEKGDKFGTVDLCGGETV